MKTAGRVFLENIEEECILKINKPLLVMMRHGQSEWNRNNLFTGWVDVGLSPQGIKEALEGGKQISKIPFDVIYISTLMRAQMTAFLAMSEHSGGKTPIILETKNEKLREWGKVFSEETMKKCIPVHVAWELNERYYGSLQGMDKDEMRTKYGSEQVKIWRRSYAIPPPDGESLEMTSQRTLSYFHKTIVPHLEKGENIYISAHGNSLRSIIMYLDQLSEEEVLQLEVPTGEPLCYSFEENSWTREDVDACQKRYT